jgi:hypothetical protein
MRVTSIVSGIPPSLVTCEECLFQMSDALSPQILSLNLFTLEN